MPHAVEIENIEEIRRQAGIDDFELREGIRQLRAGDHIRLTFLTRTGRGQRTTSLIRITSRRGATYRGAVVDTPGLPGDTALRPGAVVSFHNDHIHSILARQRGG